MPRARLRQSANATRRSKLNTDGPKGVGLNPKIETLEINSLIPYARNARTHSEAQIAQIAGSIKEFGFTNPILIDKDNGIIAGHGRVSAARKLNIKEVPCIRLEHLSETQRKAYILADNRIALNSGWETELLSTELEELKDLGINLESLGFDSDEIDALLNKIEGTEGLTDEDEVPEVQEQAITKPGDIWVLGNHRLMCGDSTSVNAVDKLMTGQKADMVFTDPPYGMKLDADYSKMSSKYKGSKGGNKYDNVIGDHDDFSPDLIQTVFANFDYCKEIFLWGADYYADLLPLRNDGSWIVWDKRGDDSADKMFGSTFELCWSKARHKREMARIKWVGIFGMSKEHDKRRVHPTQKPSALIEWFFEKWGEQSDTVVDLFGGSGSTMIACEKTGRQSRLMELDPKYCDVIVKRWQSFTGKKAVLEQTGQTYEELSGLQNA
jgi:DNA modification methylase